MPVYQSKLGDDFLSPGFKYKPVKLDSEASIIKTCNGIIIQERENAGMTEGNLIAWEMPIATPEEYMIFREFHTSREDRVFLGYWGESYTVRSFELDAPSPKGRIFKFGGSWVVLCVHSEMDPTCNYLDQVQGSPPA